MHGKNMRTRIISQIFGAVLKVNELDISTN
jgi:hypothetical protein